jgi:hypothetical protein
MRGSQMRWSQFFKRRLLGQVRNLAASGAVCQMHQHQFLLVRRQRPLSKRTKLVCIRVLAGLEKFAHRGSGLAGSL